MNSQILRLWILEKIKNLQTKSMTVSEISEAHELQGKLELLKEIYEDFNLEAIEEDGIVYHNNF
jgi:hypothetical protein